MPLIKARCIEKAHVGCFVPAKRAVIGLTDKILTRVSTRESVSRVKLSIRTHVG